MLKRRGGNSFSHHFVDDLLFLDAASSVPLADDLCPVLFPPSTDHDASSSTSALTIGLVCEVWRTHTVSPMSVCVCVCVHVT